jgi:hypothetical protein
MAKSLRYSCRSIPNVGDIVVLRKNQSSFTGLRINCSPNYSDRFYTFFSGFVGIVIDTDSPTHSKPDQKITVINLKDTVVFRAYVEAFDLVKE